MCKVKGCSRPQFVGGLCGLHALALGGRAAPAGDAQATDASRAPVRLRPLRREKQPRISG